MRSNAGSGFTVQTIVWYLSVVYEVNSIAMDPLYTFVCTCVCAREEKADWFLKNINIYLPRI